MKYFRNMYKWFIPLCFSLCFWTSCSSTDTADLQINLKYASGEAATEVEAYLFSTQEDFENLKQDNAESAISDSNGNLTFSDLDEGTYWIWALKGARSAGGQVPVAEGENTLELELK